MVAARYDSKTIMLEHSKAKVELYATYLSRYLNILSRANYWDKINIYDLMCGEGIYSDNSKGSPIIALEKIKEHYYSNKKTCPNIDIWFNDKDKSQIEPQKFKIERVKGFCSKLFVPPNVDLYFSKEDYIELYPKIINKIKALGNEKLLLFIDPYGYKEIKPIHIKNFLENKKSEIILFLPISHMYRFANKSIDDEFQGGIPLRKFLLPLFGENYPEFRNVFDFINKLRDAFRTFLEPDFFVDTFTIQRDKQNVYCLFFFTSHIKGFETMLGAKWDLDEKQGKGFRIEKGQTSLFTEIETSNYSQILENHISSVDFRTNKEIYQFGLENGFLPKHSVQVFKKWQKDNSKFKVLLKNGSEAKKGAFYISYKNWKNNPDKIVNFIFK